MILLRINAQIGKKQRAPTETFMHFALASPVITYVKLSMYTVSRTHWLSNVTLVFLLTKYLPLLPFTKTT